ncbi:undecaprenyl-diphosphatase (plasmid) [Bacillus sp. JAS24-2]|uniref:undecaprenyl-diphosphatase n=1 Tax=Bacillus sp. JAS24-2 TaxID=2217832 RepID=UPI0011F011C5|nr:undecaprenyl-diphosphatase [Bacillus sp. JAS24-2]QEL82821.1 undecaprenyl-diphosphatase [Bacillus sp. JAS24-2]
MILSLNTLDYNVFKFINGFVKQNPILDYTMIFFAEYAQYFLMICLLILWILNKKGKLVVLQTILACSTAFTINKVLGLFFYRDRPFISHFDINQLVEHAANSSFPSDHATSAFVIGITLWLYYKKRLGAILLISACLIAFSRVWVGVHYPLDVLAGVIIGCTTALSIHYFFQTQLAKEIICKFILKEK